MSKKTKSDSETDGGSKPEDGSKSILSGLAWLFIIVIIVMAVVRVWAELNVRPQLASDQGNFLAKRLGTGINKGSKLTHKPRFAVREPHSRSNLPSPEADWRSGEGQQARE
jgi:hypothetical protein